MNAIEITDPALPTRFKDLLPVLRLRPGLNDTRTRRVSRMLSAGGCRALQGSEPKTAAGAPQSFDSAVGEIPRNFSDSGESAADRKRHLLLGQLATAGGSADIAALNDVTLRLCGSEPFSRLADSPFDCTPLSALALIVPVAQRLAKSETISLTVARREVLSSLGLDGDVLDWSNENSVTVCQVAGVTPTFEGLCWIEDQDLLSCVIIAGLGLEDTKTAQLWRDAGPERNRIAAIARLIVGRHAPQPDPWVQHVVMKEQRPIGNLAIKYVQIAV